MKKIEKSFVFHIKCLGSASLMIQHYDECWNNLFLVNFAMLLNVISSESIASSRAPRDDTMLSESSSAGSLNTFFPQHLQTILKLMPFIDGPWLNPTSILMMVKCATSMSWTFLINNFNIESDSMHSNANQKISRTIM